MKKIALIMIYLIFTLYQLEAQVPNSFKYQAVVRNNDGGVVVNQQISLRLSILENSSVGLPVYSEVFQYTTNEFGIVAVNIGTGIVTQGIFTSINWGLHPYFLQVEIDITGGENYRFMGSSQILAVPYAMYALDVKNNNDADADPNNEIQDLQLVNNVLKITRNASATEIPLSQYLGSDTDDQTLSLSIFGSAIGISIQDGNSILFNLPSDFVSKASGGIFGGPIQATNILGTGILNLQQNYTVSGVGSIVLNSSGATNLTLPTTGTLATESYVNNNTLTNNLLTGRIFIGENGVAVPLDARGNGQILIGDGNTLFSRAISGDATLANNGAFTLVNTPVSPGSYNRVEVDSKGRVTQGFTPTTLAEYGITDAQPFITAGLSTQYWRGDKTWQTLDKSTIGLGNVENTALSTWQGSANLNSLGTVTTGVWNAGSVTSTGAITGNAIIRAGGTSSQFLKADGSVDGNTYLTTSSGVNSIAGTANQIIASPSVGAVTLSLPSNISGLTSVTSTGFTGSLTGNASTATRLQIGRTISISGDLVYNSPTFDGAGDITAVGTLASVNSNPGTFGSATVIPSFTVNAKGLITAVSTNPIEIPAGSLTGTTLAGNIVFSSLTSVGTINNGIWSAGAVTSSEAVTGNTIVKSGGTSTQFLKADGSVDANTYLTASSAVSSINGTPNQILASSSVGNVTLSLPSSITGLASVSSTGFTGALSGNSTTATALQNAHTISITGDLTYTSPLFDGSGNVTAVGTLANVNGNNGTFGSATEIPSFSVNTKGLITGVSTNTVTAPAGTLTGSTLASNVVSSSLSQVGTITSGTWNTTGSVTSDTGAFTTLNVSNIIHLTPLAAPPAGSLGSIYVNTDSKIYFHDGTNWVPLN